MKPIRKVHTLELQLLKSTPPQLVINATGEVPTGGWKNGTLALRFYEGPPKNGLIDYDFVAEPPAGPNIPVVLPIAAQTTLTDPPAWLRGVRVRSATNHVVAKLGGSTPNVEVAPTTTPVGSTAKKVSLAMQLDPDVLFAETAVWLEGRLVDGWAWDKKNSAYVRTYEQLPVAGLLDVRADARSMNEPNVKAALALAVVVEDGTPSLLTVNTQNFQGRAEAHYHV